jgi:hypothetical protein
MVAVTAGCDPLIATVGVEGPIASQNPDGGNVADATKPVEEHDAATRDADVDATHAADGAAGAALTDVLPLTSDGCLYMPDLADPYAQTEGGVRRIESGPIVAAVDEALGCTQPRIDKAVYVTYTRKDGSPLMREGVPYLIPAPAGSGGTLNTYLANAVCEQSFLPTLWFFLAPPIGDCRPVPGRAAVWRVLVPIPSPFPKGFQLCERCP